MNNAINATYSILHMDRGNVSPTTYNSFKALQAKITLVTTDEHAYKPTGRLKHVSITLECVSQ